LLKAGRTFSADAPKPDDLLEMTSGDLSATGSGRAYW